MQTRVLQVVYNARKYDAVGQQQPLQRVLIMGLAQAALEKAAQQVRCKHVAGGGDAGGRVRRGRVFYYVAGLRINRMWWGVSSIGK